MTTKRIDLTTIEATNESSAVAAGKAVVAALKNATEVDIEDHGLDDAEYSELRDYLARRGVTLRQGVAYQTEGRASGPVWIEMDDRTSYRVNDDGTVTVSSDDEVDREDEALIAESLGHRLGGTWSMRAGEWSSAAGESQVTSIWREQPTTMTIRERDLSVTLKFLTPPANQGQIVEVSYAGLGDGRVLRRTYDRSDRSEVYAVADLDDAAVNDPSPIGLNGEPTIDGDWMSATLI